jgi:hypothetical protein
LNWLLLGCFDAAALPLRCRCAATAGDLNRIAAIELAAIGLIRCQCATAPGALNRSGAIELAAIELDASLPLRYCCLCFKSGSCN